MALGGDRIILVGTIGSLHFPQTFATGVNASGQVVGWGEQDNEAQSPILWESGVVAALLPPPAQISRWGRATAINASGEIVGVVDVSPTAIHCFRRAVLWRDGQPTDLGVLGAACAALECSGSGAYAINARGQVVGSSTTSAGETHAFLWEKGVMIDLGTLGGTRSEAAAISESGRIVGSSTKDQAFVSYAVLWRVK